MRISGIVIWAWIVVAVYFVCYMVFSRAQERAQEESQSIRVHQTQQIAECRDMGGMPITDNRGNLLNCSFPPWKAQ